MAAVIEHVLDLGWSDAGERERRDGVFREEIDSGGFEAQLRSAAGETTDEEKFVGVEWIGRVVVEVVVVDGGQFFSSGFVAGLFADFAEGGDTGRVADVGPTAREGPGTVVAFFDEEDAIVVEDGGTDVDFWSGVTEIFLEEIDDGVGCVRIGGGGKHFGGDLADLVEAFEVEGIFGVGEAVLGDGLEALGPLEPLGVFHGRRLLSDIGESDKEDFNTEGAEVGAQRT